jgi:hypothetical protein
MTTPAGGPGNPIQINYRRDFCHRHLRYFKRHWPKGSAAFTSLVFQAFVRLEEVMEFARQDGDGKANPAWLPEAMREFGPMCCALDHQTVRDIRVYALKPSERTKTRLVAALIDGEEEEE